jgi:tetratricopeptide (TPR) repeat protein
MNGSSGWSRRWVRVACAGGAAVLGFAAGYWLLWLILGWAAEALPFQVVRDLGDQVRQLGAAGLGLAAGGKLLRVTWQWLAPRDAPRRLQLGEIAEQLAVEVLEQLRQSPLRVRSNRPMPLRVWFRSADGGIGASRFAVTGVPGPDWEQAPIHGDVGQVSKLLRSLPRWQLVVLGEPGAGKSVLAVMLAHQLLSHPQQGEPVPLVLPVSSWNPTAESVGTFVTRRLREDFGVPPQVADRLVTEPRMGVNGQPSGWWVLPVLDGLDEVAPQWHPAAVTEVERFAASDHPVVVTCRVREFQRAVTAAGVLTRAAVVRLEPLQPNDVVEFLSEPKQRRQLWQPVFDVVQQASPGPLGQVLSTPLMVGLAKDAYAHRDPGELARLRTRQQITGRLIDGYVEAVYRSEEPNTSRGRSAGTRRYPPEDAARWLGSLAYLAYLDGTRDLRWWRLPWTELVRSPERLRFWGQMAVLTLLEMAVLAMAAAVLMWPWAGWQRAAAVAGATMILAALCVSSMVDRLFGHPFQPAQPVPRLLRWLAVPRLLHPLAARAKNTVSVALLQAVVFGAIAGFVAGLLVGRPLIGSAAGVAGGLAMIAMPTADSLRSSTAGPEATLRTNHLLATAAAIRAGVPAAAVFAATGFLLDTHWMWWAATGFIIFAASAALASEQAWLRFRLAHLAVTLPAHRRDELLPRRLIAFLQDGIHPERATLRVNGTAWQFRHALIQDHLANTTRPMVLRRRADAGDGSAARELAGLLREQGNLDEAIAVLRRAAAAGDWYERAELVRLLREQGNLDEAIAVLRPAAARDGYERGQLVRLLREQGNLDEAMAVLRPAADAGDGDARRELAGLLRERGNLDEAMAVLRRAADAGDWDARRQLAELLQEQGNLDELHRRADAGDGHARWRLARLLRERGNLDEAMAVLRPAADADDWDARRQLAELLREQGNLDELHRRADAGDGHAREQWAALLREQGNLDEAMVVLRRAADARGGRAREQWAMLLREQGNLDELRRRADAGDGDAARELAGVLREQGNLDEAMVVLRRAADAGGGWVAREQLAVLLREQGNLDELRPVLRRAADAGGWGARRELAELLRERGNLDEAIAVLRRAADAGDRDARRQLAVLLRE